MKYFERIPTNLKSVYVFGLCACLCTLYIFQISWNLCALFISDIGYGHENGIYSTKESFTETKKLDVFLFMGENF